jgi:ABC-2 type transport system permease protein
VKTLLVILALALVAALRLVQRRRARQPARTVDWGALGGDVALVAAREIRERLRSRMFKGGTLVILIVVGAAIVIPVLTRSTAVPELVGVLETLPQASRSALESAATTVGTSIRFVSEPNAAAARRAVGDGRVDVVVTAGDRLLIERSFSAGDTSTSAQFVSLAARDLGVVLAMQRAQLTPSQVRVLAGARSIPVESLHPSPAGGRHLVNPTSLIGDVLIFMMLSQYNTWILVGVMEEKSSRVIEVLLAAVRPLHLLGGKVLGIGTVALAQAGLIVAFAVVLAEAVGSSIVRGSSPLAIVSTLVWLILGYAFYSWVYAAAGSMAERQEQVQSLALPLSLPMVFGYVVSLIGASSGSPSLLMKVIAYLPPTAPFAMPVLVGLRAVAWWQFGASMLLCVGTTVVVARVASGVYRRSILRTGRRVRWREVLRPGSA